MSLPRIIVISLDRSEDRRKVLIPHLCNQDLEFSIFPAIDGAAVGLRAANPYLRDHGGPSAQYWKENPPFFCGPGVNGLMMTYIALAKCCLMLDLPEVIILEDDVVLCPNFRVEFMKFRQELALQNPFFLYAHLGSAERYCSSMLQTSERVAIGNACCTEAMLYSRKGLQLISERGILWGPFDAFLIDHIAGGQRVPIAHPFKLARQRSADGEIGTTLS